MDLGPLEILVILAVVVMIFGVGKLPEVGSALGKGIREFRSATHEDQSAPKPEESKAEPAQSESLNCSVCGAPNAPAALFCTNCGRPVAAPAQQEGATCPACGAPNTATVRFCTNCGRPMTPVAGA